MRKQQEDETLEEKTEPLLSDTSGFSPAAASDEHTMFCSNPHHPEPVLLRFPPYKVYRHGKVYGFCHSGCQNAWDPGSAEPPRRVKKRSGGSQIETGTREAEEYGQTF